MLRTELVVMRGARIVAWVAVAVSGCATHRIPEPFAAVGQPRASWVVRAGDYLQEREVCSSDRDQRCTLPVSTAENPVSVVVTVYLHPAGDAETKYHGAFLIGFTPGHTGRGAERKVDFAIPGGGKARALSVASRVVESPGVYPFDIALFANVTGQTEPHQFVETVVVHVGAPMPAAPTLAASRR